MPHAVGHGARGGIGHLVRFADDERVEREFAGIEQRGGLFDLRLEKGGALRGGEELDVEIGGVNVPQGMMRSENRDSIVLRLKSFGQWRYSVRSLMDTASTSSNQVEMVVSDKSWLRRERTIFQMSATEFTEALLSFFGINGYDSRKFTPYIIPKNARERNTYSKYKTLFFAVQKP